MSKRVTKGQIAAATANLECIRELAADSFNGKHACYQFHAVRASDNVATLLKAGQPLPEWLTKDLRYFKAMGWSVPA